MNDLWVAFWRSLEGFLRGLAATPAGADLGAKTAVVEIGSTGYSREAEEDGIRAQIVAFARAQVGDAYRYGAEHGLKEADPKDWDCSELTENAYRRAGKHLPDGAAAQKAYCRARRVRDPRPADLFFLGPNLEGIPHVGLYAGEGQAIEARSKRVGGKQTGAVQYTARALVEAHPRFQGWYRHPDLAWPQEERA